VPWLCPSCVLAVSWLCPGCVLAVSWLCSCCVLAVQASKASSLEQTPQTYKLRSLQASELSSLHTLQPPSLQASKLLSPAAVHEQAAAANSRKASSFYSLGPPLGTVRNATFPPKLGPCGGLLLGTQCSTCRTLLPASSSLLLRDEVLLVTPALPPEVVAFSETKMGSELNTIFRFLGSSMFHLLLPTVSEVMHP
jgi:hypothetical protein